MIKQNIILAIIYILTSMLSIYVIMDISQSQYNPSLQDQANDFSINPASTSAVVGQPEKYLLVEKIIFPQKEFYSLNESIRIYVEVKSLRFISPNSSLENIKLDEILGIGLNITDHSSKCCKISDIDTLVKYKRDLALKHPDDGPYSGYPLSYRDGILHAEFPPNFSIRGNDRLVFWYNITPSIYGILSTTTIIGSKTYSNLDYPFTIKIKKALPIFDIIVTATKSRIYQFEELDIVYNINYLGDTDVYETSSAITDGASVDGYFKYANKTNKFKKYSFKRYETLPIRRTIIFPHTGGYFPPGISIDGVHFSFEKPLITVDDPISRHENILNSIYLILLILSALIIACLNLIFDYSFHDISSMIKTSTFKLLDSTPPMIRAITVFVTMAITVIYILNLEYIRYITILLTNSIYLPVILLILVILVYDFKHKPVFYYWILFLISLMLIFYLIGKGFLFNSV